MYLFFKVVYVVHVYSTINLERHAEPIAVAPIGTQHYFARLALPEYIYVPLSRCTGTVRRSVFFVGIRLQRPQPCIGGFLLKALVM